MMRRLRLLALGSGGAIFIVAILAVSGLFDVASSSRRSTVADWFWGVIVRQSVTLRSVAIEEPPLTDASLIRLGAGHYDRVCAACHGSPTTVPQAFAADLVPQPPRLMEQMEDWRPPARIFWTVKNGIRHSAMPAWPTQLRDDEVWAMVAFLLEMPKMTATRYAQLAGIAFPGCDSCHAAGEQGASSLIPRLDIQTPEYITAALRGYRERSRPSGIMIAAASNLSDQEIAKLAAALGRTTVPGSTDGGKGETIAVVGIPDRQVPPCESCHGPDARADYPRLAGQNRAYLLNQLKLFATLGERRGGPYAEIMATAVRNLSEAEMMSVAEWYGR